MSLGSLILAVCTGLSSGDCHRFVAKCYSKEWKGSQAETVTYCVEKYQIEANKKHQNDLKELQKMIKDEK